MNSVGQQRVDPQRARGNHRGLGGQHGVGAGGDERLHVVRVKLVAHELRGVDRAVVIRAVQQQAASAIAGELLHRRGVSHHDDGIRLHVGSAGGADAGAEDGLHFPVWHLLVGKVSVDGPQAVDGSQSVINWPGVRRLGQRRHSQQPAAQFHPTTDESPPGSRLRNNAHSFSLTRHPLQFRFQYPLLPRQPLRLCPAEASVRSWETHVRKRTFPPSTQPRI